MKYWHYEFLGYVFAIVILLTALVFTVNEMDKQNKIIEQWIMDNAR